MKKIHTIESFSELPIKNLSERVLGERAEDFEQMLEAPRITDGFWSTRFGGADARDAVSRANIPILLTTGYNDFYVGGVFKMWEQMDGDTKKKSALLVSPYNHGDGYNKDLGLFFQNGKKQEEFGADYQIAWFDNIRNGSPISFEKGVITYYRTFENKWQSDFYKDPVENVAFLLGEGVRSFKYDPQNPCAFREEGLFAEMLDERQDVVSIYTEKFDNDTFVKGIMQLKLVVESDCPDTAFYVRISIQKPQYTYVLRHDITSLCYQLGDYQINQVVDLEFNFDDYAFLIEKGDCLRIDISSTDDNVYVCHTNRRGEYYLQSGSDVAINKIHLDRSCLILPIEHTTA